jgi:hypothetical protein
MIKVKLMSYNILCAPLRDGNLNKRLEDTKTYMNRMNFRITAFPKFGIQRLHGNALLLYLCCINSCLELIVFRTRKDILVMEFRKIRISL